MDSSFDVQVGAYGLYLAPRPPRKERPQRRNWKVAAFEIEVLRRKRRAQTWQRVEIGGRAFSDRPYLIENPVREIAFEQDGIARCPACQEVYTARLFERIMSPAFLRAQRWAHAHNAEHHPRRWVRSQHFQAPIPAEIRERVAS